MACSARHFFLGVEFILKIHEIITVHTLQQPTAAHKKTIFGMCNVHYRDNIYYHNQSDMLIVCAKTDSEQLGYAVGIRHNNPKFNEIPQYIVPQNLYSWANDHGQTTLSIIKAMISLSKEPVISDIEMTTAAKKFLQKSIENGNLKGKIFNLNNGDVGPYDPDVWITDDNYRVLIMENMLGIPLGNSHNIPIFEGWWNWLQIKH